MRKLILVSLIAWPGLLFGQQRLFPLVKEFGGIFEIPQATVRPDPSMVYNIVVDIATPSEKPEEQNPSLIHAARLMNLHVLGGVPPENLHVIIVVHSESTYSLMTNEAYKRKYKTNNPNVALVGELQKAGARVLVCGQSLVNRKVEIAELVPGIEIALSMITTVTTYQLKGYAYLKY